MRHESSILKIVSKSNGWKQTVYICFTCLFASNEGHLSLGALCISRIRTPAASVFNVSLFYN